MVIRGCNSAGEWLGIYDCGSNNNDYISVTGTHNEWLNKDIHKDIDIAVNRAKEYIDEFIAEHDTNNPNTILLTGHSRGGTIVNILGSELEGSNYAKMYTYTFNAMNATLDAKQSSTIFNIFDSNDFFINVLPFANEKFERNGNDICEDINNSSTLKKKLEELKNADDYICVSDSFIDSYNQLFSSLFDNRDNLYELINTERSYVSLDEAQTELQEFVELTDSSHLGLDDIMSFSEIEELDGKYSFTVSYYNATLLRDLSKILAYGQAACVGLESLFEDNIEACKLFRLLSDNASYLNGAHYLINSYVITQE